MSRACCFSAEGDWRQLDSDLTLTPSTLKLAFWILILTSVASDFWTPLFMISVQSLWIVDWNIVGDSWKPVYTTGICRYFPAVWPLIYTKTLFCFWPFLAFLTGQLKSVTGNRVREGEWQSDPGRESNPGPLQSLGTWVARATNRAKRRPKTLFLLQKRIISENSGQSGDFWERHIVHQKMLHVMWAPCLSVQTNEPHAIFVVLKGTGSR